MNSKQYDIIIIGCGPAGMTAAIYAKRLNLETLVIESGAPGGMMVNTEMIANYPGFQEISGVDLSLAMYDQMMKLGAIHEAMEVKSVKKAEDGFVVSGDREFYGKALIIATGTKNKTLGITGENKYFYRGISWCAICDGPLYKGRDVAVVGGGNSALSSVVTLSKFVRKVYLIHRRDEFRGDPILVEKVKNLDNVEIVYNSNITNFIGMPLEKIEVKNNDGNVREIPVSCVFEAIGRLPNSEFIDCLKDQEGFIIVNEELETNISGIFACGDVIKKGLRQIATAVNDGAIAAMSASKYLK